MSNIFDTERSLPSLSYQEKSLYGTLAADLIVYVPYFVYAFGHPSSFNRVIGAIVLLIVVQIVLQSVIAIASRNRLTDERDRLITLRGYRAGYLTLISLIVLGLGALWIHTSLGQMNPSHLAIHFLSAFTCLLVISDLVKVITQLVAYRRSI